MTAARVYSGDMVRRPYHIADGWWLLVMAATSESFSGRWCRTGSTVATLKSSAASFKQDGEWSTLCMVKEAL
jgi:hypothetical protein